MEHDRQAERWAIGLTWCVPSNQRAFGEDQGQQWMSFLTPLHAAGKIATVMPFRHRLTRTLGRVAAISEYWLIVLARGVEPDDIWSAAHGALDRASNAKHRLLARAEVMRPQPGIEMYYTMVGGLRAEPRWHWIEYAVSRPSGRDEYYRDQYVFSAAVIRRFYERGAVARCVGFETLRYLRNDGTLPNWDVVHITGFSPMRLAQIAWTLFRLMAELDAIARRVGHSSAVDVLRSWDALRQKYQGLAAQDFSRTLQWIRDPALIHADRGEGSGACGA